VRAHSALREQLESLGVTVHENVGAARFVDPHNIETGSGLRSRRKVHPLHGRMSRRLPIPGFQLTSTHSDAWQLTASRRRCWSSFRGHGCAVASIFHAFGSWVQLFEAGRAYCQAKTRTSRRQLRPRFARRHSGARELRQHRVVREVAYGVRMNFSKDGVWQCRGCTGVVAWLGGQHADLNLAAAASRRTGAASSRSMNTCKRPPAHLCAGDITAA